MNNTVTFNVSETAVQRAKRRMLAIELSIPVFLTIFFLLSPISQGASGYMVGAMIFILVVIEAVLIIESTILLQKMKEMTLTISAEGIERNGGRFTEKIPYRDMNSATIAEYPSGEAASIKLELRERKPVTLQGFEKLEWVAQQIEAAFLDKSLIRQKRLSIDWDNPWLLVLMIVLLLGLILFIQRLGRDIIYPIVNVVFLFTYGLIALIYRPISRSIGKRFEKFEIILGVLMMISGIVIAIGNLAQLMIP